ncbi:polyadenylate-binding protein 2-like isoform X2 [Cloeon dipterum]
MSAEADMGDMEGLENGAGNGADMLLDDSGAGAADDAELEAIKARVREMEEEAEKLKQLQSEVDKQMKMHSPSAGASNLSVEEKMEVDARSVYVGNVDYGATAEELEQHFHGCGSVNRVTILCNKYDGHPKGFAYIEFADREAVATAMAMDESLFRGRQIKVMPKRTNRPGLSKTDRPPRGMGAARFRGGRGSRGAPAFMGYRGAIRGRGIRYVAPPAQEAPPPQVMPIMAQYHPHQPPALGLQFPH